MGNRREEWVGNVNVGVVSRWMIFRARSLDEVIIGLSLDREEVYVLVRDFLIFRGEEMRNL